MPAAIEIRATRRRPLGMSPAQFLRDYWQKRPLLIRGFSANGVNAITPEDLAGLACEEFALARIVTRDTRHARWSLRSGPFAESDFAKLGARNWTLLVQDVDKWDADVATLLDHFSFLPSWRIDDVMVSYAVDGGGVGPHVDHYDVFLIQGMGKRRWQISVDPAAPKDFRADSELKLLSKFVPTHEWILDPGDVLYLPPGVPHDGVAVGACLTYSVGMRAPSQAELSLDFAEFLAESLQEDSRYRDGDLVPVKNSGEIDTASIARVRAAMPHFSNVDNSTLSHWFGRFITRYRSAQIVARPGRTIVSKTVLARLAHLRIMRNPFSRIAWRRLGHTAEIFAGGEAWPCSLEFARRVSHSREIDGATLTTNMTSASAQTLTAMIAAGHLQLLTKHKHR